MNKGDTNRIETILHLGAEGGSITLEGRRDERGVWRFRVTTNEAVLYDMLDEEPPAPVKAPWVSWGTSIALLSKYPWPRLSPVQINTEFDHAILDAVAAHKDGGAQQVAPWRERIEEARAAAPRKPRNAMNAIIAANGLHRVKDKFQKTYMAQQCDSLMANLDDATDATLKTAPVREQGYLLDHSGAMSPNGPGGALDRRSESALERQIFDRWSAVTCEPVRSCWHRIVAFQTNLPSTRDDKGWGEVDLLGVADDGLPVVIELKQGKADDTRAKVIVQAVAYGLALQKAWCRLREEWRLATAKYFADSVVLPTAIHPLRVICAAPQSYWDDWFGDTPKAKTVPEGAWTALDQLVDEFKKRGISITAVTVSTEGELKVAPIRFEPLPALV